MAIEVQSPLRVAGEKVSALTAEELRIIMRRHEHEIIRSDCDFCLVLVTAFILLGMMST